MIVLGTSAVFSKSNNKQHKFKSQKMRTEKTTKAMCKARKGSSFALFLQSTASGKPSADKEASHQERRVLTGPNEELGETLKVLKNIKFGSDSTSL